MHRLVSAIESSQYVEGLFAWTSMMTLCIAQIPVEYRTSVLALYLSEE